MHLIPKHIQWMLLWLLIGVAGAAEPVLVLYPDTPAPYDQIYGRILQGMRESRDVDLQELRLSTEVTDEELLNYLTRYKPKAVVLLGSEARSWMRVLGDSVPVVVGAVDIERPLPATSQVSAISLYSDPNIVFENLLELAPRTRRILVVYEPGKHQWLIDEAAKAAAKKGLTLIARSTSNMLSAARMYRDLLSSVAGKDDALWLLENEGLIDRQIIPSLVVRRAWDNRVLVFSSNPAHVKNGVLFSLYPDNEAMGKRLAVLAASAASGQLGINGQVQLQKDLLLAVNLRTAHHLRLRFSPEVQERFSLTFRR